MRELLATPNLLSLSRVVAGAAAMLWLAAGWPLMGAAMLVVLGELLGVTGWQLAGQGHDELGRSVHAACGSIFHLSVFLACLIIGWMPLWTAVVVYFGELALPYLRSFSRQFKAAPPSSVYGQFKGASYGLSQLAVILVVAGFGPGAAVHGVPVAGAVFTCDALVAMIVLFATLRPLVAAGTAPAD